MTDDIPPLPEPAYEQPTLWQPPAIPPVPGPKPPPELSVPSMLVSEWARELLMGVAVNNPRSLQAELGASEIGQRCDRRIAYRLTAKPVVNYPDPLKVMFGTGMHSVIEAGLRANAARRYLVEIAVNYRGVPGKVDCIDPWRHRLIDWKTSQLSVIQRYQREGVGNNYRVQLAIYAEGAKALGHEISQTALVFIPRDGDLSDVWSWVSQPNKGLADDYIDRYQALAKRAETNGPGSFDAAPGPLCTYCPNYQPGASDLTFACPGKDLA